MEARISAHGNFHLRVLKQATAFALAWAALTGTAQRTQRPHPPVQSAAIERLAAYASSGPDNVGQMLNNIGFRPSVPGFKAFPAVRKIESAYFAAEEGEKGTGELVLALLSKQVCENYESAREDPTLKQYAVLSADPSRLHFATPPSNPMPGPEVRSAITTLADYSDGNALGGPQGVLRDYFGLSPNRVYEILRTSDSTAAAIAQGLNWVPESERHRKLADLVAEIDRAYDGAAMKEVSLDEYRAIAPGKHDKIPTAITNPGPHPPGPPPWSPNDPLNPYNPPSPNNSGGDGGNLGPTLPKANEAQGEENYRQFVDDRYTGSSSGFASETLQQTGEGVVQGVFDAVVEGAGGFGGIVFGNTVVESQGLGKLVSVSWIPSSNKDKQQTGRLVFNLLRTSQGTSRMVHRFYGPVLLEDASAAYRIIYSHEGLPEWSRGQGIGIMSLYDREDYIDCDANRPSNHTVYWRTLLNPALLNSDLGNSAVMVDSLPIVPQTFAPMIIGNGGSDLSDVVDAWLATTPGTWKFVDRPMIVGSVGERITVLPEDQTDSPGDANRFIGVRAFDENPIMAELNPNPKESLFSAGFRVLFPEIVRGSHEFSRVNGFAPVLALFRWAKVSGATFVGSIPAPIEFPTPEALVIDEHSIRPAKDMPPDKIRALDRANADQCLSVITDTFPAPAAQILVHEQSIWRNAALTLEPAAAAGHQVRSLLDRSEYIESLARAAARQTQAGRILLSKIAQAEDENDANDSADGVLTRLTQHLVNDYSSAAMAGEYHDLQGSIQTQESIIESRSKVFDAELRSALDDEALSRKLIEVSDPSGLNRFDSTLENVTRLVTAASNELTLLNKQSAQLKEDVEDAEYSCYRRLSTAQQAQFEHLRSDDMALAFLSQGCTGFKQTIDQAAQKEEAIANRRSEEADVISAAENQLRALVYASFPKIGIWREFSSSYAPISDTRQELENSWPHVAAQIPEQSAGVGQGEPPNR